MAEYSIDKFLKGILYTTALSLGYLTPVYSMDDGRYEPSDAPYHIRVSTQIKSEKLQKILLENQDKISFVFTNGDETYQPIGMLAVEDIKNGIGQRLGIGEIDVPSTWTRIAFFIHYGAGGTDIYNSCLCHRKGTFTGVDVPLLAIKQGQQQPLSAIRIDLDLNFHPDEAPVRGSILAAYDKSYITPTVVSNYLVGGHGITEVALEIAKDMVNEKEGLKIPLGPSRKGTYIEDPDIIGGEEDDNSWLPAGQIMFAGAMIKQVADLIDQEKLTLDQQEVVLTYLVHIQKCNRADINQLREDLGMPIPIITQK